MVNQTYFEIKKIVKDIFFACLLYKQLGEIKELHMHNDYSI